MSDRQTSVTDFRLQSDGSGKQHVVYQISTFSGREEYRCEHRFSDFVTLHGTLCKKLITLPPKFPVSKVTQGGGLDGLKNNLSGLSGGRLAASSLERGAQERMVALSKYLTVVWRC